MCLYGLLRVHLGECFTRLHPLAEPPPLIPLARACWATSPSASGMERGAIRHPASGGSVMAQRRQAHTKGGLFHPGDCARPVGHESAQAYTSLLFSHSYVRGVFGRS
jgi:hypothetical protein